MSKVNNRISAELLYKSKTYKVKGNDWLVMFSSQYNYVSVKKQTNNPFGTLGKEFKSIHDAIDHYKSKEMKDILADFYLYQMRPQFN